MEIVFDLVTGAGTFVLAVVSLVSCYMHFVYRRPDINNNNDNIGDEL